MHAAASYRPLFFDHVPEKKHIVMRYSQHDVASTEDKIAPPPDTGLLMDGLGCALGPMPSQHLPILPYSHCGAMLSQ